MPHCAAPHRLRSFAAFAQLRADYAAPRSITPTMKHHAAPPTMQHRAAVCRICRIAHHHADYAASRITTPTMPHRASPCRLCRIAQQHADYAAPPRTTPTTGPYAQHSTSPTIQQSAADYACKHPKPCSIPLSDF